MKGTFHLSPHEKNCTIARMKTIHYLYTNIAGLHHPPHPLTLTVYPPPGRWYHQLVLIKMTAKDVKEIT